MCGRFTLRTPATVLMHQFGLEAGLQLPLRYNIAPSQQIPVIREVDGKRQLSSMRWGLVPPWAADPRVAYTMINARSEEAASKRTYRGPLGRQRCLIPADGFYEWQKKPADDSAATVKKSKKQPKRPMYIRRRDEQPFAFAGLWERWNGADPPLESCTILTTRANETVAAFHDRMPVILSPNDYEVWLNPAVTDPAELNYLFDPYPANELTAFPVNPAVNNGRYDAPECMEPIAVVM